MRFFDRGRRLTQQVAAHELDLGAELRPQPAQQVPAADLRSPRAPGGAWGEGPAVQQQGSAPGGPSPGREGRSHQGEIGPDHRHDRGQFLAPGALERRVDLLVDRAAAGSQQCLGRAGRLFASPFGGQPSRGRVDHQQVEVETPVRGGGAGHGHPHAEAAELGGGIAGAGQIVGDHGQGRKAAGCGRLGQEGPRGIRAG